MNTNYQTSSKQQQHLTKKIKTNQELNVKLNKQILETLNKTLMHTYMDLNSKKKNK